MLVIIMCYVNRDDAMLDWIFFQKILAQIKSTLYWVSPYTNILQVKYMSGKQRLHEDIVYIDMSN